MQSLIGESSTLADVLEHVSRVAPLNRPIVIIGERGTGKELIAERLHFLSPRWQESFHKINCAAISEALLDSELFGHEPGAFTGATKLHVGRFERAHGGTLFLDELGTMPARIQEKLLRLIEYGEFERLGGSRTLKVDVRVLAATNADLPGLASKGRFRHDLLDRLAFDVVHVPPLRERLEDLPALVHHFGARMAVALERDAYAGFSVEALLTLRRYSWPGNIRELRNVVERSVCHWPEPSQPVGRVIINPFCTKESAACLPQTRDLADTRANATTTLFNARNFQHEVKQFELTLLREALNHCKHHQQHTADALGLSYHQLRALLRKYRSELE